MSTSSSTSLSCTLSVLDHLVCCVVDLVLMWCWRGGNQSQICPVHSPHTSSEPPYSHATDNLDNSMSGDMACLIRDTRRNTALSVIVNVAHDSLIDYMLCIDSTTGGVMSCHSAHQAVLIDEFTATDSVIPVLLVRCIISSLPDSISLLQGFLHRPKAITHANISLSCQRCSILIRHQTTRNGAARIYAHQTVCRWVSVHLNFIVSYRAW